MLGRNVRAAIVLGLAASTLLGCSARTPSSRLAPLRVGMTPTSPPFAFRQGGQVVGLEPDFARALAAALGRPLELRQVEWDGLIPTLQGGRIDVIMSGMTITPARQVQIVFSDPYLRSGLLPVVRRGEVARYPDGESVLKTANSIGVMANTTSERFVREREPRANLSLYPTPGAALTELLQRRVDAVIHDAPVMLWLAANEAELAPVLKPLNQESLGWGMRRSDEELRAAVNGVLARWRADGTREQILSRWIPYWSRLEDEAGKR
ncbi:MAG: amino acid ABC transporter substrate-binding protein [Deltaproteobacteria bacterium]|nr:MAG: amino acid ABC transporter substrate-binding protein [Deltaproteobacteria bacterium]